MEHNDEEHFLILSDLWRVLKKKAVWILSVSLLVGILASLHALRKPIVFVASGSFKEGGATETPYSKLSTFLMGAAGVKSSSGSATMMMTRKLATPVVREMGLQARVSKVDDKAPGIFNKIVNNLAVEYAKTKDRSKLPIPDHKQDLICRNVTFLEEFPVNLQLRFISENTFKVIDKQRNTVDYGELGETLQGNHYTFTIFSSGKSSLKGKLYNLKLLPEVQIANQITKSLSITPSSNDRSLLTLSYVHSDRHLAADVINNVMWNFQEYLQSEAERRAERQLSYLKERQQESIDDFDHLLQEYADYLSSSLQASDFMTIDNELNFLATLSETNKRHALDLDLDLRGIQNALDAVDNGRDVSLIEMNDKATAAQNQIEEMNSRLRSLKEQRDTLEMALRMSNSGKYNDIERALNDNLIFLKKLQNAKGTIDNILCSSDLPLQNLANYEGEFLELLPLWFKRLQDTKETFGEKSDDYIQEEERFKEYLKSLKQVILTQENIVKERISRHQLGKTEFDGIDMATAEKLYYSYSLQIDELQSNIKMLSFAEEEMQNSDFEIGALSSCLADSISSPILEKSAEIIKRVDDSQNRSAKEIERLQEEIDLYRHFLRKHVAQKMVMLEMQEKWRKEKIRDLQEIQLELVRREIAYLEKQAVTVLYAMQENRQEQKAAINERVLELRHSMEHLPQKMMQERRMSMRSEMNRKMLESLTEIVEGKVIGHNLESIESGPVDLAVPPIMPESPRLSFYGFIGLIIGFLSSSAFFIFQGIIQGFPVSSENLTGFGYHYAGFLDSDERRATLRKALNKLSLSNVKVLLTNHFQTYFEDLARLLSKKGCRVIVLDFTVEQTGKSNGLIKYLEQEDAAFDIEKGLEYDYACSEVWTPYLPELLSSTKYCKLLENLQDSYDCIIVITDFSAAGANILESLKYADGALLIVNDEKLKDLEAYHKVNKPTIFISERKL